MNNRSLEFVQTRSLISLVNDNHVDNNNKEILVYVYFGSILNNLHKKVSLNSKIYISFASFMTGV